MPELSETPIGYMRTPNGNVIELFRRGAQCFTRTYQPLAGRSESGQPSSDTDIGLTDQQADEYRRIMLSCGGVVSMTRERPRLVAEKEQSA